MNIYRYCFATNSVVAVLFISTVPARKHNNEHYIRDCGGHDVIVIFTCNGRYVELAAKAVACV